MAGWSVHDPGCVKTLEPVSGAQQRFVLAALLNLSCASGIQFESMLRLNNLQNGFHTAKTQRRSRLADRGARTLYGDDDTPVLRPARWRVIRGDGMSIAEALGRDDVRVDALRDQVGHDLTGPSR